MAASCMMKQTDERHVLGTSTIELMKWSPRRDLVAISNSAGDVILRRLSWKKVWRIPKKGDCVVKSLVWRPDCEVLAVGYNNGEILLIDIETGESIHTIPMVGSEISHMKWEAYPNEIPVNYKSEILDNLENCMPDLPLLNSKKNATTSGSAGKCDLKKLGNQKELNILWVGTSKAVLQGFVFGIFHSFSCDLSKMVQRQLGPIVNIQNQGGPSRLVVLTVGDSGLFLLNVQAPPLEKSTNELYTIAMLYGKIMNLTDYIDSTIQALQEAWEDGLVDLEGKLSNYGKNAQKEVSLSADLLELLVFGQAPKLLKDFLVNEITDKGLKRLGQAMELSYADMHKLVIEQLTSAGYSLSLCLNQLFGFSKQIDKFGSLGLDPKNCCQAFRASGSFLAKTYELVTVINSSMKYLKTFFLWLFSNILTLSNEQISQELASTSEQDLEFIANFLKEDFDLVPRTDSSPRRLKLERVGQYLKNESLTLIPDTKDLPWNSLMEKYPKLSSVFSVFDHNPQLSLTEEFRILKTLTLESFFEVPARVGNWCLLETPLLQIQSSSPVQSRNATLNITKNNLNSTLIALRENEGFFLVELCMEEQRAAFFHIESVYNLTINGQLNDIDFYNSDTLSILLGDSENNSVFAHLSIDLLRDELLRLNSAEITKSSLRTVNAGHLIDSNGYRLIDFSSSFFAVNSIRKVAAILSRDQRKVRIFDMEVDEEEDEDNEKETTDDAFDKSGNSANGTNNDVTAMETTD